MAGFAPDIEPFTHPALFYRGVDEYLGRTVPFVVDGLKLDEPVAVAVPSANLAALRAAVAEHGDDLTRRVQWLDMTEAGRNPGRIIPYVLRAFADRYRDGHVRVIGEPIWAGRTEAEYPACVQHEALINHAFRGRDVTILCPYDLDGLTEEVLLDAEATHPLLMDATRSWPSDAYAPDEVVRAYDRPLPELPEPPRHDLETRNVRLARDTATTAALAAGVSPDQAEDVRLVVAELVTNSVEHGGGTARLRTWHVDGHFVCEVFDTGRLANPLAGRIPVPPTSARGRGLLMVNALCSLVRIHTSDEGTAVRAYFALT
jgi:anti-sigma regulatory factor (Ser/Thr protein kinase)